MRCGVNRYRWLLALLVTLSVVGPVELRAHPTTSQDSILARREPKTIPVSSTIVGSHREGALSFTPLTLSQKVRATVVTPARWQNVGKSVERTIQETFRDISALFGTIPAVNSTIRIMEEETFFLATGAPRWTNALFYRGQVMIPLALDAEPDYENIYRAVRHEFTHALLHALSQGRAPGWLDEGLAQWAEGDENPALKPALHTWLTRAHPIPLNLLLGGFTRLDESMVAVAYAQSLFATNTLIQSFGFKKISRYFELLRDGVERSRAFQGAFALSEAAFEQELHGGLIRWASREAARAGSAVPVRAPRAETTEAPSFQSVRSQLREPTISAPDPARRSDTAQRTWGN